VNLQLAVEKARLVRFLKFVFQHERWMRKTAAAEEAVQDRPVTCRDVEAAPAYDDGVVDNHPLFVYRQLQTVIDGDRLFWQAGMDLYTHNGYPDSEIAKAKILAAAQMQRDAKARVVQALRRWADELEAAS